MKIVLLESLGISQEILDQYAQKLKAKGHTFENYPKDTDPKVQIERSQRCRHPDDRKYASVRRSHPRMQKLKIHRCRLYRC